MKWNCPHCGILLSAVEDQMGRDWAFSQCYQCNGYGLIRQPEIVAVKVNHDPKTGQLIVAGQQSRPQAVHTPVKVVQKPKTTPVAAPVSVSADFSQTRALQVLMGLIAIITLSSGFLLYQESQRFPVIAQQATITRDEIRQEAMAPVRAPAIAKEETPSLPLVKEKKLKAKPKVVRVNLRSGPGLEHNILGTTLPNENYNILEWKNRWLKIQVSNDPNDGMWVRNDMVDVYSE